MSLSYYDLLAKTVDFPQDNFKVLDNQLYFHDIFLEELVSTYGTPLKLFYLPKIRQQIQNARQWFRNSIKDCGYEGNYYYAYCTKASHLYPVIEAVMKEKAHIELSSAFDTQIVVNLLKKGLITKDRFVLCNGYKTPAYIKGIEQLLELGFTNVIPILDNEEELKEYADLPISKLRLGIRLAIEEQPTFDLYTSRFGIGQSTVLDFYMENIKENPKFELYMLHMFVYKGIRDSVYYWNELSKGVEVYTELKAVAPELNAFNIGGGFPVHHRLNYKYNYGYMAQEIVKLIQQYCKAKNFKEPDLFTEFGTYTVGESGATIFRVAGVKKQNDREIWYIVNNSLMNSLPDTWGKDYRFILLPLNGWNRNYQRVLLGGLTCDNDDYYYNDGQLFLPKIEEDEPLYLAFFHTGAYQDALSGFGGAKHCLIPNPKYIMIDKEEDGTIKHWVFKDRQRANDALDLLGF